MDNESTDLRLADAFGNTIERCWDRGGAPGTAYEIVERDDGFISALDASCYFTSPDQWSPTDQAAFARCRGRVLDIGCGAGRHAVHLMKAGHDVLGVEPSSGAARVARERGVTVIEQTLENLTEHTDGIGVFDTILLAGQNLGLLESQDKAPSLLRDLARLAAKDAVLVGVSIDPHHTTRPHHRVYGRNNERRGRLFGQERLRVRETTTATAWFDYLFLAPEELNHLLADTPWAMRECLSDGPHYVAELSLT
ncbi:class I SAM-dependent methyltransferase [Streptomyces anulatus]|uniref:class I SAM-dependent methyltransferase n=1 Tax=Streptomyces anulatus TaxID=1892 RepID=UPI002E80A886|nr:class I SAM-dependent methyltransferase [Streptomyces anulatus]WUC91865.1 class I SAM-dependent methyltransferase [Streptomyces anulatus]